MNEQLEGNEEGRLQHWISIVMVIVLALAIGLCLYVVIQVLSRGYANIGGFMMFRVVTGSMEPTIPVGALLITREADIETIRLDDIVCFRTQVSEIWGKIVTHRVVGVLQSESGEVFLETKGDANLVSDIYYVDESNLIGKIVWHSGDESILNGIFSLFTNKIGFLGCIVFPTLFITGLILKDSVSSIRKDMLMVMEMSQKQSWEDDPLCGMTQEEYEEMYERIRAELMEELMQIYGEVLKEQQNKSENSDTK